jgi:hypothetical protein
MASANRVRSDIANALDQLVELGIAVTRSAVVSRDIGRRRTYVGFSRPAVIERPAFGSIDEYLLAVRTGSWSAVLMDGSLVQLEYECEAISIEWHRLTFLPIPWPIESALLVQESLYDAIEMCRDDSEIVLRTPLRFDYAPLNAREEHPASHCHFNHEACRLAVASALTPREFIRLVLRTSFPVLWTGSADLHGSRDHSELTLSDGDAAEFHWMCRGVED